MFDTYTSPLFIVPRANFSAIRSSSFSIPAGVLSFGVEVSTISSVSKPNLFFSSIGVISALLSVLLSITIVVLPFSAFAIFSSSGSSFELLSITNRQRSAILIFSIARSIPICSTSSETSARIPAVSRRRSDAPFIFIYSSIVSRVVPGISVTIARSERESALRSEDLPTFGFPTITVCIPSRSILPVSKLSISSEILELIRFNFSNTSSSVSGSTSSG